MMAMLTVVYDACVLYPAPLRDLLMQLAIADIFRARWTDQIHEEWIRNVLTNRNDLKREQLERTRELMNRNVRDCLVNGYEGLIAGLSLPDEKDRHVLAAAIHCHADTIVTFNLKDFPDHALAPYGVEAIHPDNFVANELDLYQPTVCESVRIVRARLKNPVRSVDEYLATLDRQGLAETVASLRNFTALL
ncbi:MAG: PIN domain-containing protein [Singulisphaera sp.]